MAELARRRADDGRIDELIGEMKSIRSDVQSIRDMLISEPEASPLGRSLLARSVENRREIDAIDARVTALERWWAEMRGGWKWLMGIGAVLGVLGTFFGIAAFLGFGQG